MKTLRVRVRGEEFLEAMVDDADYAEVCQHAWRIFGVGYVGRKVYSHTQDGKSKYRTVYLHRLITGATETDAVVDHINRDKLDNRRSNLRICTQRENSYNRPSQPTKHGRPVTSRFKGVRKAHPATRMKSKTWLAEIRVDGRTKSLGYFATEEEAAESYNVAAKQLHHDFAYLNSIPLR